MNDQTQLQHFPMAKAHYCLDCKSVGNSGSICPSCGCAGANLMPLAPILDRVEMAPKVSEEVEALA
jgi:hypothetical protein